MDIRTKKSIIYFWVPLGLTFLFIGINILLLPSPGTVDARNFEAVLVDTVTFGSRFIPSCLQYLCPSNFILGKFPPGHFLLFYLFSYIFPPRVLGTLMALKFIIFLFYILTFGSVLWFTRTVSKKKVSTIWLTAIYLSSLSLILNTQGLAYTDVLTFPFLIFSIGYLIRGRDTTAGIFFAISCLVKWQPIILLPVFVVYVCIRGVSAVRPLFRFIIGLLIPIACLYLLDPHVIQSLVSSFINATSFRGTVALNILWILQNTSWRFFALDAEGWPSAVVAWGQICLFAAVYGLILLRLIRFKKGVELATNFLMSLLMAVGAYYLLSHGVHENHFIMGTVIAILIYVVAPTRQNAILLLTVDVINTLNMFLHAKNAALPQTRDHAVTGRARLSVYHLSSPFPPHRL